MKSLLITKDDIEIFRLLWMTRIMTVEQIRRARYFQEDTGKLSNLHNVRHRLNRLAQAGYLKGDFVFEEGTSRRMKFYTIDRKALDPLSYHYGIEQKQLYSFRGLNSYQQVFHALLVSEFVVRLKESLRETDAFTPDLKPLDIPFYHTHTVGQPNKKKHTERFVSQVDIHPQGQEKALFIRPDLVFALQKGDRSRLYFLEADRGSEGHTAISMKLQGYHHYNQADDPKSISRKHWQSYGEMRDFRVLFVTTSEKRIVNLRERLKNVPGFYLVAFTTLNWLRGQNVIYNPIWVTTSGSKNPLLKSEG